ncbi:hypothetical protein [Legionella londiniensis]|uniref:Putative FlgJ-like protein n=1 Tax=Legionella londiniensis TaxID=45068 RepID=A0A0W0VHU5_9GAMM|nr:hypothetical protein [Legionella londiniensis]KTD19695.1 putative FlgJ-like protein [Legionella londiniensis]STX92395.1 putative FlgJ-like protein [Legionella londiniensis]
MHNNMEIKPHPSFLEILFAHKSKVSSIFRDIIGIHEINHIAVSCINARKELITFSSTPALEYNLFSSNLWCFDKTYQAHWYERCTQSSWQSLYSPARYDELYYIKQGRHRYPLGMSLAAKWQDQFFIYSLASRKSCQNTHDLFSQEYESFYKIGQYCSSSLIPLFTQMFNYCEAHPLQLQPIGML